MATKSKNTQKGQESQGEGKPLTPKQKLFVESYLKDLNGTAAYKRVYKKASDETARTNAARLLAIANIREEVDRRIAERAGEMKVTADEVIKDLRELRDMCMGRVKVKRTVFTKTEDGKSEAIEVETTMIDPHGAKGTLELLGKHIAMFTDKHKIDEEITVIRKSFRGKDKS